MEEIVEPIRYLVSMVFMDEKKVNISLLADEMGGLLDAIGKNEVYYNSETNNGLWIPIEKIRYFRVRKD